MRFVKWIFLPLIALLLSAAIYIELNYKADLPLSVVKKDMAIKGAKYFPYDSTQVHYLKRGKGPILLLVHGFGGNLRNWTHWQSALSDSFTVISMDLPGYGITGPTHSADYSDEAQVAFVKYFCDHLKLDSFYLAGNSMGGSIAWKFALKYPDKVKKLILLDSAGYPRSKEDQDDVPIGFKLLRKPWLSGVLTKLTPTAILRETLENTYGDESLATEEELHQLKTLLLREGNRQVLIDRMQQRFSMPDTSAITKITAPTLIMWGDMDNVIKVTDAYKFERDIPNSQLIIYPGVGHLPMNELPEQSASDVRHFLNNPL